MTRAGRRGAAAPAAPIGNAAWRSAYDLAQANAIVFFITSATMAMMSVTSVFANISVSVIYFLGSLWAFLRMVRAGGGMSPISYFILGAAIYFGYGTAHSVAAPERVFVLYFGAEMQRQWLRSINLLNSLSVLSVLLAARPWVISGPVPGARVSALTAQVPVIARIRWVALLLSFPVLGYLFFTFPGPKDPAGAAVVSILRNIPPAALVLMGLQWKQCRLAEQVLAILLFIALCSLGILELNKTAVLLPMVALFSGLLLGARSPRWLIATGAAALAFFVFVATPIANYGRSYPTYRDDNTLGQRAQIVAATWDRLDQASEDERGAEPLLGRVALAPIQAFLIQEHDAGHVGTSFENAWAAIVPRVFWPDKPVITRFGDQLDAFFFRRAHSGSALAPTYSAEILWNTGWAGVIWVSALIGMEIGWLTRKWHAFTRDPFANAGILLFSIPAIVLSLRVETWVVATFVGGFMSLVIAIEALDVIVPFLGGVTTRPTASRVLRGRRTASPQP